MTDIPTDVRNQIYRPTIKQLLKWNGEAMRKLELGRLGIQFNKEDKPVKEDWRLVDCYGNFVDAKMIRGPMNLRVTHQYGNGIHYSKFRPREPSSSPLLERPFQVTISPPSSSLTYTEFKMVLGEDFDEAYCVQTIHINAMWQAIEQCPTLAANAYVLGDQHHQQPESEDVMIPVQYYHINPRRHRALKISQYNLNSILEDIERERKHEDEKIRLNKPYIIVC